MDLQPHSNMYGMLGILIVQASGLVMFIMQSRRKADETHVAKVEYAQELQRLELKEMRERCERCEREKSALEIRIMLLEQAPIKKSPK